LSWYVTELIPDTACTHFWVFHMPRQHSWTLPNSCQPFVGVISNPIGRVRENFVNK
jgi:hypothetical protein